MSRKLTRTDAVTTGDLFVLFKTSAGDYRGCPASEVLAYFQENLEFSPNDAFTTQYSAPSSTGFSVTITDGGANNSNVHLILTPTAGFAEGTIVLPDATGCVDKQEILVNCTQSITTLTIDGNGATVTGEPAATSVNDFFRLKFDKPTTTWYRVG